MLTKLLPGFVLVTATLPLTAAGRAEGIPDQGKLRLHAPSGLRMHFDGVLGQRIDANLHGWLLPAPDANPGLLEMFRVRDRKPTPQLVPWAGEFVGKYLISAVQALRMVESPELEATLKRVVDELLTTQDEDGYLGPFPKAERLLGHWDLWGHYHIMLGLMMYAEDTGDSRALDAVIRAADLACRTYLDTGRRVYDAGSHEMNMAIIHVFGRLYRLTGHDRYLRMMRHIEQDWERAGDYFRAGLAGVDFYRSPRPRWESLHDLQGLVELYRITGNADYATAFENLWTGIVRYDRHNSGAFSTGEGAVGSPYRPGAIETCCTTAWMALSIDMLLLTGDARVADELEWSTYNAVLAAQHPTGRWWTYDTPMDGVREASAHSIVFQARAGTPELNCCSVNGPRGLGMLSEWAVLLDGDAVVLNHYGPSRLQFQLRPDLQLALNQETNYPADGQIKLVVEPDAPAEFTLKLRIPGWSRRHRLQVNGQEVPNGEPRPGPHYRELRRRWAPGDTVQLDLDMSPRYWTGEQDVAGKAALFRGPLLLAFDVHHSTFDASQLPTIDLRDLHWTTVAANDHFAPIVLMDLKTPEGSTLRLCDFATAGAHGTEYRSWLPAVGGLPPVFDLKAPRPHQSVAPGPIRFEWVGFRSDHPDSTTWDLLVAEDALFQHPVLIKPGLRRPSHLHRDGLQPGATYFWKVVARNQAGATECRLGPETFQVDPTLTPVAYPEPAGYGPDRIMIEAALDGAGEPTHGKLSAAVNVQSIADRTGHAGGATQFNGRDSKLQFDIAAFPDEDYTVRAWVYVDRFSSKAYQQVFSAWCRPMDDPLRICVIGDQLCARIEAGRTYAIPGVKIEARRWIHVAVVKEAGTLHLYVDGQRRHSISVPETIESASRSVALGANPAFAGNEYFEGRIDDFALYASALPAERIARAFKGTQ